MELDPFCSDDNDDQVTRPNRWRGAPSTWRKLTEPDRSVYHALEIARQRDLSTHLFSAYAARRQALARVEGQKARSPGNADYLSLSKDWTAWPMRTNEVPAPTFTISDVDEDEQHPQVHLEEEISASILKVAKDKFQMRMMAALPGDDDADDASATVLEDRAEGQEAATSEQEDTDTRRHGGSEAGSSTTRASGTSRKRKRSPATFPPVLSADDELSYRLLRPAARRILARLDDTLTVLHNARVNTVHVVHKELSAVQGNGQGGRDKSPNADALDAETVKTTAGQQTPNRRYPELSSKALSPQATAAGSIAHETASVLSAAHSVFPKTRDSRAEFIQRLKVRDWREVVGAAALAGFSPGVIARTAQRCANMFGQGIQVYTLAERSIGGRLGKNEKIRMSRPKTRVFLPGQPLPYLLADDDFAEADDGTGDDNDEEQELQDRVRNVMPKDENTAHYCPWPRCPRSVRSVNPFQRPDHLKRHIDSVHGGVLPPTESQTSAQGRGQAVREDTSFMQIQNYAHLSRSLNCPWKKCERHDEPFPNKSNLNRHIKGKHAGQWPTRNQRSPPPSLRPTDDRADQRGKEKEQATGNPAPPAPSEKTCFSRPVLFCPCAGCRRSRGGEKESGFTRLDKLERHLGRAHRGARPPEDPDLRKIRAEAEKLDVSSGEEMEGAVHVDGFLRRIKTGRAGKG